MARKNNSADPLDRFSDLQKQGFMKRPKKKAVTMYRAMTPHGATYTGPKKEIAEQHVRQYGGHIETFKGTQNPGPHKGWFDRCVAGVRESGSADDPEAVCGSVLKHKRGNPLHPKLTGGYDYKQGWFSSIKNHLKGLKPGDFVKVIAGSERFWVELTSVSGSNLVGTISNHLLNKEEHGLKFGDKIAFSKSKVADVQKKNPRKGNPESDAAGLFESFHGTPSTAVDEYEEKEHYHSNLAALGELVGLKVRTVSGYDVTLGFDASGRATNPRGPKLIKGHPIVKSEKDALYVYDVDADEIVATAPGMPWSLSKSKGLREKGSGHKVVYLGWKEGQSNPKRRSNIWPFNSLTRTTVMHVPSGHKFHTTTTHKGHTIYKSESKDGYVVPGIERDSVFDSVKDAKKFIDHWTKHRPNPRYTYGVWRKLHGQSDDRAQFVKEVPANSSYDVYKQLRSEGIGLQYAGSSKGREQYTWDGWTYYIRSLKKKNPKGKRHHGSTTGPFASSQQFVGDTIGAIYRPMNDFIGYAGGLADKGLGKVGLKGNPSKPTIYEALMHKLGRTPTNAELKAEVARIKREAYEEVATKGKLPHQRKRNPDHVLLCSTEDGNNLQLIGGDQSLDLDSLKIDGPLAEKELVTVGEVWGLNYRTEKVFGDGGNEDGLTEYIHILGPKETKPPRGGDLWQDAVPPKDDTFGTGELPTLVYDKRNQKLTLSGGMYHINQPLMGTSPGIEN